MSQRKILVSNDDGIMAAGLRAITRALLSAGYDVRVAAPSEEQSAKSQSITMFGLVTVEKYILPRDLTNITAIKVSGTPVDCVKIALNTDILGGWRPDLVVSGINKGLNTGLSIHYSGTCGAAREGNICGIPAVALSLEYAKGQSEWHYESAAKAAVELIDIVFTESKKNYELFSRLVINANFPNVAYEEFKGWKLTKQGLSCYRDSYKLHSQDKDEFGEVVSSKFLIRGDLEMNDPDESYDTLAVLSRYVSVTPLGLIYGSSSSTSSVCDSWSLFKSE